MASSAPEHADDRELEEKELGPDMIAIVANI